MPVLYFKLFSTEVGVHGLGFTYITLQMWFKSTQKDRKYQFWERRPLADPLYTDEAVEQKLNYIHRNPIDYKWKLAEKEADYFYSSAVFYLTGEDKFGFLKH